MRALLNRILIGAVVAAAVFLAGYATRSLQEASTLRAAVAAERAQGEARLQAVVSEIDAANARVAALQRDLDATRAERQRVVTRTIIEVRNAPSTFTVAQSPALRAALSGLRDEAPSQD